MFIFSRFEFVLMSKSDHRLSGGQKEGFVYTVYSALLGEASSELTAENRHWRVACVYV